MVEATWRLLEEGLGVDKPDGRACGRRESRAILRSMKCPSCSFEQPDQDACSQCGLIFAKWAARQGAQPAQAAEAPPEEALMWPFNWFVAFLAYATKNQVVGTLLALVMLAAPCGLAVLGVLWYNSKARSDIPPPLRPAAGAVERALREETLTLRTIGSKVHFGGLRPAQVQ